MCHCADLPLVPTKTEIVILQHPHERPHPFGTARLAALCLPQARVHEPWPGITGTLALPLTLPAGAAVLYPHPRAVDLATLPPAARPTTLVLLDGTWSHAKRLYYENDWLHELPHVRLCPSQPSRYRIRREPQPDYVSTLEAIVEALRVLEPDTAGLDAVLVAFDRMIDRQIGHAEQVTRFGRFKAARQRPCRRISPLLADAGLLVAYGESSRPGGDHATPRQLVHWVATRIGDDAMFEAVVRPAGEWPTPDHLKHMRLTHQDLAGGEPLASARARFHRFAGANARVAAWTNSTFDHGREILHPDTVTTTLKTNYCDVAGRRAGLLEDVVRREGLLLPPSRGRGRAGERQANALAVARWLRSKLPSTR